MKVTLATFALGLLSATSAERSLQGVEKVKRVMGAMQRKADFWDANVLKPVKSVRRAAQTCTDGKVTLDGLDYGCENVDFLGMLGNEELKITREGFDDEIHELADMWGWLSPEGREVNLLCLSTGVRFIDSTDPTNPINLGFMESVRLESYWCDIKVYKDVAYIVKDRFRSQADQVTNGVRVFDLKRLDFNATDVEYFADYVYDKHGSSHNIVMNTETGFAYTVGNNPGSDSCEEGLHAIDLSNPLEPVFAGCAGEDGYVHDAQCVLYKREGSKFNGREICFGYDEDTLTIFDVSDKSNMTILSRVGYPTAQYTHQGMLNEDMTALLLNDELDEEDGGLTRTRTYIFNVEDLENPFMTGFHDHKEDSIDHNLYMWGVIHKNGWGGNPAMENPPSTQLSYLANYCSGLRIIDVSKMADAEPKLWEVGFFDVSPECDYSIDGWWGSWSTYMHPSGVVAISGIEKGLFFVKPRMGGPGEEYISVDPDEVTSAPTAGTTSAPAPTTGSGDDSNSNDGSDSVDLTTNDIIVAAVIVIVAAVVSGLVVFMVMSKMIVQPMQKKNEVTAEL